MDGDGIQSLANSYSGDIAAPKTHEQGEFPVFFKAEICQWQLTLQLNFQEHFSLKPRA